MNKKIVEAINDIDDEYIEKAHPRFKLPNIISWANFGKLALCGLCLMLIVNIGGNFLGVGSSASYEAAEAVSEEYDNLVYGTGIKSATTAYDEAQESNTKLIVNASMEIETTEYDKTIEKIVDSVAQVKGYAQSTSTYASANGNRYYEATLRIPSENYEAFIEDLKDENEVTYYSQTVEDITATYQDLEARLKALKAQETKVLAFYEEAKDLDDLMSIESRLSDLRYEIESIETEIKNYDVLTSYATLRLNINESINHVSDNDFGGKIKTAFINGWYNFVNVVENIVIFFSYHLLVIVLIIIVLVLITVLRKRKHK